MPSTPMRYWMPNIGIQACGLDELVVGAGGVEAPPEDQRRRERHERGRQGDVAHQRLALGTIAAPAGQQHQERAGERKKDD